MEYTDLPDGGLVLKAKQLISEFLKDTQEENPFEDPRHIVLATKSYDNGWEVAAVADLPHYQINLMLDDGLIWLRSDQYENLQHMIDEVLCCFNSEKLTYVSEEEWALVTDTSAKLRQTIEEKDADAGKDLLLSTFPIVRNHTKK